MDFRQTLLLILFVAFGFNQAFGQAISAGSYHSVALKEDGTVVTWGDNSKKQRDTPSGLKDVVAIAAGGYHSLALKEDGTVVAWGYNAYYQFLRVPRGLKDVVAIAAGNYHSMALKEDRTVVAWGDNGENQCDVPSGLKVALSNATESSSSSENKNRAQVTFNQVPKDVEVTTVAVLPIDGKDCSGQVVSGQNIASFTEGALLGLYNVVERRNLERVLDEQRLALSGLVYEKSAIEAGCNVGAQGIIFAEYGCLTGQETIQLKLVDCQTSELYWAATGVNATAQETLDRVREELIID